MKKILNINQAIDISKKLRNNNKSVVLVGGCFDILHIGHIQFLKKAKKQGDFVFILLESDESIKKLKGVTRPIHTQKHRAEILSYFSLADFIVLLPPLSSKDYDDIVVSLHPALIATTNPDPNRHFKENQANKLGVKVVDVINRVKNISTSHIAETIAKEI